MPAFLRFEVVGYRDAVGRYAKRSRAARGVMRDATRGYNRSLVAALKHYAPEKTGIFKAGIRSRTWWVGDTLHAGIYATGQHAFILEFLVRGTKPHLIPIGGAAAQMAKGYPLRWIDEKTGEERRAWQVWHPGTTPDPFVATALDATEMEREIELRRAARTLAYMS